MRVIQHFWRRPLAAVTDAFADAGFILQRIAEPRPSTEDIAKYPVLRTMGETPIFIVYRFRLADQQSR